MPARIVRFVCMALFVAMLFILIGCVRPDQGSNPFEQLNVVSTVTESAESSQPQNTPLPPQFGPSFEIIPDSELVFSPSTVGFNLHSFIQSNDGFLKDYEEEVNGAKLDGSEILARISREYSLNPCLLLAVLEYQSHWVTQRDTKLQPDNPLVLQDEAQRGLYHQLSWAANTLNRGYYLHRVNALKQFTARDGQVIIPSPAISSGTISVEYLFSQLLGFHDWELAVSPLGFYTVYDHLFGDPFAEAIAVLLPVDLKQPTMQLPFAAGEVWNFTSGPHSAWGDGAAWAALDFAPPGQRYGCFESYDWVLAVADGLIVRAENGMVVLDLDGDGYEQTGWTVLYQHIAAQDRVPYGTQVEAGDHIGHPSCEGGPASGSHVHLARRYNGEWIPADQNLPFNLDGWISHGIGKEYDGTLTRNGIIIEAHAYYAPQNQIER